MTTEKNKINQKIGEKSISLIGAAAAVFGNTNYNVNKRSSKMNGLRIKIADNPKVKKIQKYKRNKKNGY